MAVVQSQIHPNLNRDKIVKDTWFCYYCLCGGAGLGPFADPLVGGESKFLCLHSAFTTADIVAADGCCGSTSVLCCLTEQYQIPPLAGAPKCICFNKPLSPGSGVSHKDGLFDYAKLFGETWWLMYAFCFGIGFSGVGAGGRPIFGQAKKFLICRGTSELEGPVTDGVFCSGVGTEFCLWNQCQFPPAPNNPKIGCCGWRLNKASGGGQSVGQVIGKPTQVEMS